jgi:hypothetical protein
VEDKNGKMSKKKGNEKEGRKGKKISKWEVQR